MARATPLKWVQAQGGWASAKVLLDIYGHHLPAETAGYADALASAPERPYTAPRERAGQAVAMAPPSSSRGTQAESDTSAPSPWWARPGSNGGPPACKDGDEPNEDG